MSLHIQSLFSGHLGIVQSLLAEGPFEYPDWL